ncbi:clathrin coat assembly protein AP180 [Rhodamnia argentea]|uniref:Clathrin coat assembly protein AP180 n=1 Tax=Rhodamnia argentea TaxID=178133 RepID=A0ABM3HLX7_9MYRT|nr:clathrin coat assembly protein AP180 [Rhodamnia argentea]
MPSKLKKAIGAVKDHTSISLAKVGNTNATTLEVALLKATSHDEVPMEERYVDEILQLVASNKVYAATCAQLLAKRIGKTRNWIVALKCLMLVLRIFQDGDPYFPREVLHTMKRGGKILNLSSFRDHSKSSPWDYTSYVRIFALYLDERLDCFLMGKLQRQVANRRRENERLVNRRATEPIIRSMKPGMLLDRISHWQRLLERAIATRPTGSAKGNNLVQISLHAIVQESFDLYRDISDGLALLLDSFFQLQYQTCVNAFQTSIKASKQFEELSSYYILCKTLGVGRTSEYPSVQKISDELIETLREFLKDQDSFPASGRMSSPQMLLPAMPGKHMEGFSEKSSEFSSQCMSLEDMMSMTDSGTSPSITFEQEIQIEQFEKQPAQEDSVNANTNMLSSSSDPQETSATTIFVSFDDWPTQEVPHQEQAQHISGAHLKNGSRDFWELELAMMAGQVRPNVNAKIPNDSGLASTTVIDPFGDAPVLSSQNNPFLQDTDALSVMVPPSTAASVMPFHSSTDLFTVAPTFQATPKPTFGTLSPNANAVTAQVENDPFASSFEAAAGGQRSDGSTNHENLQYEQQLWLQSQNKIIAKHMT